MKKMKKSISRRALSMVTIVTIILFFCMYMPINIITASAFSHRTTAPLTSNAYYYSSNPFYKSGYGMPNCTCYAYGRAWELLGSQPKLSTGNAGRWYWYNKSNGIYNYGSTPRLGAIACWDKYDQNQGHVAVVEAINGNTVTISESHYKGTNFDTRTINSNSSNYLTSMRFLGYIYIGDFGSVSGANHSPIGNVDLVEGGEGKVHIRGWTFDEDDSYKSLEIHVYIGGPYNGHPDLVHATGGIMADNSSTDVTNVYNVGGNHRFDTWIDTSARGNQNIYIYAIDANDSSGNKLIGSGTANITEPIPQGTEMTSGAGQTIPDGDYIIVSELGRRIYLDIPGTQCPADGGVDVAICASSTLPDKSGYFDTWTVSYIEDGFYKITQKGTDVSLDVKNDSKAVGTEIMTCEYHDGHNQQWSISSSSHGYTIQSRSTSWYLDVRDAGTATGTRVQTCGKNGSKAQSWGFIPVDSDDRPIADGKYFIKSAAGDVYLDADGDKNYVNGSNIQVWGGNTDSYNVTYAENGFYTICETSSGLAVEVDDEDKTAFLNKNKNVQLGTFTGERRQLWKIVDEGDGKYRLVSKLSGYSLDLQNALTADGSNVADHPYNTSNAQKWYFEPVDSIKPEITDVQVTDVSGTGYTVTCKVTDDGGSGLDRVQFPTWTTNNGQDDIQASWQINSIASGTIDGDTVTFRVNVSDHGNEHGTYRTHIYAYDKHNNSAKAKVDDIEIPHIYKEETVPANCTTNGTKTYTCEICGDTYTEEIPATGHKFKETVIAPSETSQGYTLHECEYCDYRYRDSYTEVIKSNPTVKYTLVNESASLTWNTISGAEKYALCGYIDNNWKIITETTSTSYVLKGLKSGPKYKICVFAMVNGKWNTDTSNSVTLTIKSALYPNVNSIEYNKEFHQFRLHWNSIDEAEKYGVAVKLAGKWKVIAYTGVTTFTSPKLKADSTYELLICAKVNGKWDLTNINSRAFKVTVQ